jgi:phosphatidylglycerophosphate synthase
MRPTFERAILAVDAFTEKAAIHAALEQAERLTDKEWSVLDTERERPFIEIALSNEEWEDSDAAIVAFLRDVQHAYALLQANLAEGGGGIIVPSWLRYQTDLTIADITQDWKDTLSRIHQEGVEAFISWLRGQTYPTHAMNFFAARDKRRREDPYSTEETFTLSEPETPPFAAAEEGRPWDARLARWLVRPLAGRWVRPNHLTTLRLTVGLGAAVCFLPGTYLWSNLAALLLILSNFLDHTDGELARMTGNTSRFGHLYDLASDALVTILLFAAIGVGLGARPGAAVGISPVWAGTVAGCAIALIFFLRLRIEDLAGKTATRQASFIGLETEDVLYLMPLVTLCNSLPLLLSLAAVFAPMYAVWVVFEYRRVVRRRDLPA